jgi:hypothetical protein
LPALYSLSDWWLPHSCAAALFAGFRVRFDLLDAFGACLRLVHHHPPADDQDQDGDRSRPLLPFSSLKHSFDPDEVAVLTAASTRHGGQFRGAVRKILAERILQKAQERATKVPTTSFNVAIRQVQTRGE